MGDGCSCNHCKTVDLYRWASIMECGCGCHFSIKPTGHDRLCCPYPNGLKKDNPHSDLKQAEEYKKELDSMNDE